MQCAQAAELQKLEHGDISGILSTALKNAVDIQAPVFFANGGGPQSTLSSSSAHSPLNTLRLLQSMGCTAAYIEVRFPVLERPSNVNTRGSALRVCLHQGLCASGLQDRMCPWPDGHAGCTRHWNTSTPLPFPGDEAFFDLLFSYACAVAAIQFGYTGLSISPCAIPITPTGVAIVPQGVDINPVGVYITPEGVNVQPQVGVHLLQTSQRDLCHVICLLCV